MHAMWTVTRWCGRKLVAAARRVARDWDDVYSATVFSELDGWGYVMDWPPYSWLDEADDENDSTQDDHVPAPAEPSDDSGSGEAGVAAWGLWPRVPHR